MCDEVPEAVYRPEVDALRWQEGIHLLSDPEPEVPVSTVMLAAMTLVLLNASDCIFSVC